MLFIVLLVSGEIKFLVSVFFLFLIKLGLINIPPLTIAENVEAAWTGVVVIPWPKDIVSNLHLFHLILFGTPTSSISSSGLLSNFASSINFLNFFEPIFLAKIKEPTLEDLTKISSTDKFSGCSFISEILWIEHLTLLGIFSITVSGSTKLFSKARAIVKVLKMEPNS